MLVLSRKPGQSLLIGDDIEVIVNAIQGNRVSLAIKAPTNVNIRRNEIPKLNEDEGSTDADQRTTTNS